MNESDSSEVPAHEPAAFGQQLMLAREKANMSVEECAAALHLSEDIVEAIENSDLERLPPVTFVHGYIRNYARLLGLHEETILAEFENEVPHELESELHPRSALPDEADSKTPLVRIVSIVLIIAAVVLLLYAIFSYYIEKSESIEKAAREQAEGQAQSPPEAPPAVEQHARIEDDVLIVEEPATAVVEPPVSAEVEAVDETPAIEEPVEVTEETATEPPPEEIIVAEPAPITGNDVLVLETEEETWAEIVDASDIRMFYGTLVPGRRLDLTGQTPFDVFLGNAPASSLSVNGNDVEMTKYTRSNNIAHFKVMVVDGQIQIEKP
jgi:cytoskeleton protein RodZ